jgi:hypothetical protein
MAESTEIMFDYKDVVELLVKKQNLHDGIWSLHIRFGMKATNIGSSADSNDHVPTAMVGVLQIGIHRVDKENNLSIDAAKVNPLQQSGTPKRRAQH